MSMTTRQAYAAYGQATQAIPPAMRVLMLLEGGMRRLDEAAAAIEAGSVEARSEAVAKATAIVEGLHAALDLARGGEIARRLDSLYTYVLVRLQLINVRNDPAICRELRARLDDLRGAWATIVAGDTAPSPAQNSPTHQLPRGLARSA